MSRIVFAFFLFYSQVGSAKNFLVSPYFHTDARGAMILSWQHQGDHFKHKFLSRLACGGKTAMTYQVPGMKKPVTTQPIPCDDSSGPLRFTFLADTQEGVETNRSFSELIERFNSHAVIYGGDLVQTGQSTDDWQKFFDSMSVSSGRRLMVPVVGNHDYRWNKSAGKIWEERFNFSFDQGYYDLWLGPVHILVLNSCFEDDPTLIAREMLWAESKLMEPAPWKIVVFHHPPFSRSVMQVPQYYRKEYLALRQYFVPLFEKLGVDMVLNGHTHIYERSVKSGIQYITTGAAGGSMGFMKPPNPFEVVAPQKVRTIILLEASRKKLIATSVLIDGNVLDQVILNKP